MPSTACPIEALQVAAGHGGPNHAAAVHGCAFAECQSFCIVAQEVDHRARDGLRVSRRHDYPASVSEQFPGIKIRRGNNRFARTDRIGQSPGRALLHFEIRRNIDVRGGEKLDEFTGAHETIVEDYTGFHAEFLRPTLEAFAVALAVALFDDEDGWLRARHKPCPASS